MRPRMYGSSDSQWLRITISPGPAFGISDSTILKLDSSTQPVGRLASRTCRFFGMRSSADAMGIRPHCSRRRAAARPAREYAPRCGECARDVKKGGPMVYALNVFNLLPGKDDQYRDYSVKAGRIIYGMGGKVVASGWKPIRRMHEDRSRRYLIVVEFPSETVFQAFLDEAEKQGIHDLRETATTDYIWTLYEPWDLRQWVKGARD